MNKSDTFRVANWQLTEEQYSSDSQVRDEVLQGLNGLQNIVLQWSYDEDVYVQSYTSFYTLIGKRCVDVACSIIVILFILSWLAPLIAILLLFDSPGPFYFVQLRTGYKGKPFSCLKFRTMYHKSGKANFQQTTRNDARVTRLGKFLRKTNLDEMLQFINVLLGDMTLVGPRPHAVVHDALYWTSSTYRARYSVKPGITGLAQVRGARGATVNNKLMEHRVQYDHFYIDRQTFVFDMKICVATLKAMFKGDTNAW